MLCGYIPASPESSSCNVPTTSQTRLTLSAVSNIFIINTTVELLKAVTAQLVVSTDAPLMDVSSNHYDEAEQIPIGLFRQLPLRASHSARLSLSTILVLIII